EGDGGSTPDVCHVPAPGDVFTIHVHNGGTKMLALNYGCGGTLPIVLDTPQGELSIGPGAANSCEFTCDNFYKGVVQTACSDCGPGLGAHLGP
ncbi:hypothetical protein NL529_28080, partial [Klebsiella pneumoniae]|nr:hypothetical protein [Klebsiella pneumoniae]